MAGGTSNKSSGSLMDALAKLEQAKQAIVHLNCNGVAPGDPRHAQRADPAITAAIAALQALT